MDKHYSDEDLLSDLDGEVSKQKRRAINEHLEFCWSCRTRQAEMERQIQAVSSRLNKLTADPGWESRTRANLALFRDQFERDFRKRPRNVWFRLPLWGAAVAAASVALFVFFLNRHPDAPPLSPKAVLNATERAATGIVGEPVHQVFRLREVQIKPAGPVRQSRLEVWSDGPSGRFASRWTAEDGQLRHAIWSVKGKSFVYASDRLQPAEASPANTSLDSVVNAEPDLQSLEAHLMSWLRNRPWKPIVLLADVSFWDGNGAALRVDRLSAQQVRLTVERVNAGTRLELMAILNAQSSLPAIQKLRIKSGSRTVDFELSSEQMETRPVFAPATFYPDRGLSVASIARTRSEEHNAVAATIAPQSASPERVDLQAQVSHLQAHYILHLAGACRGVPVTITQETGGVQVLSAAGFGDSPTYFTKDAALGDIMNALGEIRERRQNVAELSQSAAPMAPDVTALQILARDFDLSKLRGIQPEVLNLLKRMVDDHTAGLRQTLIRLTANSLPAGNVNPPATGARDWREAASALATVANSIDKPQWESPDALQPKLFAIAHLTNLIETRVDEEIAVDSRRASVDSEKPRH